MTGVQAGAIEAGVRGRFDELQATLQPALDANRAGSGVDHIVVLMASYSVGESLLAHYAERLPSLEHRYLLGTTLLGRLPTCELVFVSSQEPEQRVLDYYISLLPPEQRRSAAARLRLCTVADARARPVAAKLLEHDDLLEALRSSFRGRPAFIEPWNVTDAEVGVATRLGTPVNGTSPALREVAFKSAGRRLFRAAGVPMPFGCEDVRSIDDVAAAVAAIRRERPGARGAVIKHDDSGAGDGNVVLDLVTPAGDGDVRARLEALPEWFRRDLARGGVVEELITGEWFASPSAQVDIEPSGRVTVLSTHEQVLGGESGQVYMGCRFPADEAYAAEVAAHAQTVGERLRELGAIGRAGIDFIAARAASGEWSVSALEINLRKGGTTHPFCALRNLVPGVYDVGAARWVTGDGTHRAYFSTDNAMSAGSRRLTADAVITAVKGAGLQFDHRRGTGIVLHMLSALQIDGRFGVTAIGRSPAEADELYERALRSVAAAAEGDSPAAPDGTPSSAQ